MYRKRSLQKYIDSLAGPKSVPGGGSASALCGALGTALLEMVCNFTVGKIAYKNVEDDVKKALALLKRLRKEFIALVDKDALVYLGICRAFKSGNKKKIDKSLKGGYYVSEKMCEMCVSAMRIAKEVSQKGNVNLITDVGCGAELLAASFNAGIFNSEVNLKGLEDGAFIKSKKSYMAQLKKEIGILYKNTVSETEKTLFRKMK